jgi:hypothetical protein
VTDWSLTTTAPNCEARVSQVLTRLEFDHVVFKHERPVIRRGKISQRLFPAFPRYIFIQAREQWNVVRNVSSVLCFIKDVGGGIVLPKGVVESLMSVADERGVLPMPVIEVPEKFKPGDRVRVCNLQNLVFGSVGLYRSMIDPGMALVALPWFNGMVDTAVDVNDLEKVDEEKEEKRLLVERQRRRKRKRNRHRGELRAEPKARV